ncbi:MAG: hypothetical protein AB1847_19875 [bacterium]
MKRVIKAIASLKVTVLLKAVVMVSFFSLYSLSFISATQGQWYSTNQFSTVTINFNYYAPPQGFLFPGSALYEQSGYYLSPFAPYGYCGNPSDIWYHNCSGGPYGPYGPYGYSWSSLSSWYGWPYSWCGNGSLYTLPFTVTAYTLLNAAQAGADNAGTSTPPPSQDEGSSTPAALIIPSALPSSMKGYELYSWPDGGDWHFTLITGTNRLKSYTEITSTEDIVTENGWVKVTVKGVDLVKAVLSRLPKGEYVFWIGSNWLKQVGGATSGNLALPDQEVIDTLKMHCNALNLELYVSS